MNVKRFFGVLALVGSAQLHAQTWHWIGPDTTKITFVRAKGDTLYSSTPSRIYRSFDSGSTWIRLNDSLPSFSGGISLSDIDLTKGHRLFAIDVNGKPWKSLDGGMSWILITDAAFKSRVVTLKVSPHNIDVLFCIVRNPAPAGVLDDLYRSTDDGSTWRFVGGAFPASSHGSQLMFAFDPSDSLVMYAGIDGGLGGYYFYSSANGGETWTYRANAPDTPRELLVDCTDPNTIYFMSVSHLYKSRNRGSNWIYADSGLFRNEPGRFNLDLMQSNNNSYAVTTSGVFHTANAAQSWSLISNSQDLALQLGLPGGYFESDAGRISVISLDTTGNRLYVGTARGLYYSDIITTVPPESRETRTAFILHQNFPNPFNVSTTITYELPSEAYVYLAIYDVLGKEVKTFVNGNQSAGLHKLPFEAVELPSGIYVYRLVAGNTVLARKAILIK